MVELAQAAIGAPQTLRQERQEPHADRARRLEQIENSITGKVSRAHIDGSRGARIVFRPSSTPISPSTSFIFTTARNVSPSSPDAATRAAPAVMRYSPSGSSPSRKITSREGNETRASAHGRTQNVQADGPQRASDREGENPSAIVSDFHP